MLLETSHTTRCISAGPSSATCRAECCTIPHDALLLPSSAARAVFAWVGHEKLEVVGRLDVVHRAVACVRRPVPGLDVVAGRAVAVCQLPYRALGRAGAVVGPIVGKCTDRLKNPAKDGYFAVAPWFLGVAHGRLVDGVLTVGPGRSALAHGSILDVCAQDSRDATKVFSFECVAAALGNGRLFAVSGYV